MKLLPNSLLSDRQLRGYVRAGDTIHDLLRCFYHGGICSYELYEFTQRLEAVGMDRSAWMESVRGGYADSFNPHMRVVPTGHAARLGASVFWRESMESSSKRRKRRSPRHPPLVPDRSRS